MRQQSEPLNPKTTFRVHSVRVIFQLVSLASTDTTSQERRLSVNVNVDFDVDTKKMFFQLKFSTSEMIDPLEMTYFVFY